MGENRGAISAKDGRQGMLVIPDLVGYLLDNFRGKYTDDPIK